MKIISKNQLIIQLTLEELSFLRVAIGDYACSVKDSNPEESREAVKLGDKIEPLLALHIASGAKLESLRKKRNEINVLLRHIERNEPWKLKKLLEDKMRIDDEIEQVEKEGEEGKG